MRRRIGVALSLAAMTGTAVVPAAQASPHRSFTTSWDCQEAILVFPVDAKKVDPVVPDHFVIQQTGGKATLGVFAERCLVGVDGGAMKETVLSGVTVSLQDGSSYDIHWGTDEPSYFQALSKLGVGHLTLGSTYVAAEPAPGMMDVGADIRWKNSPSKP